MDHVPNEIVSVICYHLDTKSLAKLNATCRRMRAICQVGKRILLEAHTVELQRSPTTLLHLVSAALPFIFETNIERDLTYDFFDLIRRFLPLITSEELESNLKLTWFHIYDFMRTIEPGKFLFLDENIPYVNTQYISITYAAMHDNPVVMENTLKIRKTRSNFFNYMERFKFACEKISQFKARKCLLTLCCLHSHHWNLYCFEHVKPCLAQILGVTIPENMHLNDHFSWIYKYGIYNMLFNEA